MTRLIHVLAALGAALVFGCGAPADGDQVPGYERDGCSALGDGEANFLADPNYNPDGCTQRERMGAVEMALHGETTHESASDIGSAEQAITIFKGGGGPSNVNLIGSQGIPFSVTNNQINYFGWEGKCPYDPTWTVARPIIAHCLVPNSATPTWAVWDYGGDTAISGYVGSAFLKAWKRWSGNSANTAYAGCDGLAHNPPQSPDGAYASDYNTAGISIYPDYAGDVNGASLADWGTAYGLLQHFSGSPGGIKYHGWKSSSIRVHHNQIENYFAGLCGVSVGNVGQVEYDKSIARAYDFMFTHELGHAWGFGHFISSGSRSLMEASASCNNLYGVGGFVDNQFFVEVGEMRNSSGVNLVPQSTQLRNAIDNGSCVSEFGDGAPANDLGTFF